MTTLRTFQCLVALVEHGSISRAARALNLSLPALSHQIASLEKELGAPVVERQRRGIRVTTVGRATAEEARVVVRAADQAVNIGRQVGRDAGGQLRISSEETLTAWLLLPLLQQWRSQRPDIAIELMEFTDSLAALALVEDGRADIAIGTRPRQASGLVTILGKEDIVVVASVGHRFEGLSDVPMDEIANEPFVHYDPASPLAAWIDQHAALHGTAVQPVMRARGANSAAQLAIAGMGVAIVPASALHSRTAGVARPLRPAFSRDIAVVASQRPDLLALEFVADAGQRGLPFGCVLT